jgi:hypothetical protein
MTHLANNLALSIVKNRSANQRLSGNFCSSAEEVVSWLGAVQAQEYLPSLWGLGARLSPDAAEQSIIDEIATAKIVRTWLMRGTIHYAPAADIHWMARLLGARVNKKYERYYSQVGLSPEVFATGKRVLVAELAGGVQLTRKEIYEAFLHAGIIDPSRRGRGSFILQYWSQEGLICFGPYRRKRQTFVLLDEWVKDSRTLTLNESLATLAKRYFLSHAPATTSDFAYWSGLSMSEARHAVELNHEVPSSVIMDNTEYWVPTALHPVKLPALPKVLLLPCFDEYAIGYKDRSAILDGAHRESLGYGVNNNIIVIDGLVVGTWQPSKASMGLQAISLIRKVSTSEQQAIQQALLRYMHFRG